ncbi:MAG: peptide chain release factor 1 [Acidimicrobiia bacterium]
MSALMERLAEVEATFAEVEARLADPDVLQDPDRYAELARRHAELRGIVDSYRAYQEALSEAGEAEELASAETDAGLAAELRQLAEEKQSQAARLEDELRLALTPSDPADERDVIMEIRSAAGGDEAALWAADLFRMYQRYAEAHTWRVEPMEASESEGGGFKEVTFAVKGQGAFARLKHEAGVHRVQRVPKTESQGRVHTSTATVAVLPEVEEVDVELDPVDVRIDVYRSSGPGGQSVNTTDSAVRLTHMPTGIVVAVQNERSQLQNKAKAFRVLRAKLFALQRAEQLGEIANSRREQVGTGERSEKIRTYNYKENRVTDHRIGLTLKRLPQILEGDLDAFINPLREDEQARKLAEVDL